MTITQNEFNEMIEKHQKWLKDEEGGVKLHLVNEKIKDVFVINADLTKAVFSSSSLECCYFKNCTFKQVQFDTTDIVHSTMIYCNFEGSYFDGAKGFGSDFAFSDFTNAMLTSTKFFATDFEDAILKGACLDYSAFQLRCTSFGMIVDQRLPFQLAYHICRMKSDDPAVQELQKLIKPFANKSHLVLMCGEIK